MKSTLAHSKIVLTVTVITLCSISLLFAQSPQSSAQKSASPSGYGHRRLMPEDGSSDNDTSDHSASPDQVPEDISASRLIKLLTEQNNRLKEKVARLEKENADLKAKLAGKEQ
jgi:hypothetical protein